jgi:hypothetical protein
MRMRKYLPAIAVLIGLAVPVYAQNTKGTGAEDKTTTTTNPVGTSVGETSKASNDRGSQRSGPIDSGNPTATRKSQALGDPKNGLMRSSK